MRLFMCPEAPGEILQARAQGGSGRAQPLYRDRSSQMNKSDLVDAVADRTGMTKADAARAVDALFGPDGGVIARALKKNDRVQITGFGTFEAKQRKARTGRNPRTGETIRIAATKTPSFRAGKGLKDAIK
jgi:DNA-binding protein HU-beta